MLYLWVKAFHIIFVVAWMASMLIYPRYKIHQLSSRPGEPLFDTLRDAALRLKGTIMTPSMVLVWLLGLGLVAINPAYLSTGWFWVKLVLVVALSGIHGALLGMGRKVDGGERPVSPKALRVLNEVPFVLLIIIVIMVVVRPF